MPRKHVHKYMRRESPNGDFPVWACGLGDCTHFLPRNVDHLIDGRSSICWECGNQFRINRDIINDCLKTIDDGIGFMKCHDCRTREWARNLQAEEDKPTSE